LVTFSGSAVEDLTAGEEEEITIPMDLSEINMLIPDAMNGRIVKLDDMDGSGRVTHSYEMPFPAPFTPWDTDFDSQGQANFDSITYPESFRQKHLYC